MLTRACRHSFADDTVPLSKPINGHQSIFIPKGAPCLHPPSVFDLVIYVGAEIVFNHMTMNCREEIWGSEPLKFKPERWLNMSAAAKEDVMPGWEGVANFGSGNRQCVGAGFAVMEIKEILLRLLTHFEFSLPNDPDEREIEGWNRMLTKPFGEPPSSPSYDHSFSNTGCS